MNRKTWLTDNENTPRNTKKKRLFVLIIGGIIAIFLLILIILFAKKSSRQNNQPAHEKETNPKVNSPEQIPLSNKEQSNCPYLNEEAMESAHKKTGIGYSKEELAKLKQIPQNYVSKLWKKGYHWWDILQLWNWKVEEKDIPDLQAEKRVGVINGLFVTFDLDLLELPKEERKKRSEDDDIYTGGTKNLVVIVRKIPSGGPKINIDWGYFNAPMTRDEKQSGHYMKKIINLFLKQENINPQQYEITLLSALGVENFAKEAKVAFGRSGGKSAGSTLYLALLSAFYKKPITRQVASTGALKLSSKNTRGKVNDQEVNLVKGTNLPIGGLKHKVAACAKKGINRLVLSKYQSVPNLLLEFRPGGKWMGCWDGDGNNIYSEEKWVLAEDYQQEVPSEIREKMNVHFAENIAELRELVLGGELS